MACTVFGTPITDETLKGMNKYHDKNISRLDKATVAFEMKNAEGKDVNAHKYVDGLRSGHQIDGIKALIYNATGGPICLTNYAVSNGVIGPSPLPTVIANGQWGAYFHPYDPKVDSPPDGPAAHAVVYSGKNASGQEYQWMFVMSARWPGRCYAEIQQAGHYPSEDDAFDKYKSGLDKKLFNHRAHSYGCECFISEGGDTTSPFIEVIMTLDSAWGW